MSLVPFKSVGSIGVNKDLSSAELPPNAWTDAKDIRFLDGMAYQAYGYGEVYNSPSVAPQFVMPCNISGARYWIYTSAAKTYAVTVTGGTAVHTDITHATPRTGVVNNWTGTLLSGIPILNTGDTTSVPMSWDLNTAHKFVDLANWPAGYYCKSLRSFKNQLVALGVTKAGTYYPYLVLWSHPADPGALPSTWDVTDAQHDAGQIDIATTSPIVDGLELRNSFIIYTESSVLRMDYVGGTFINSFTKVLGTSGALNKNCIVEIDGYHVVLTGSDVVVHDGQQATSVLDKATRRYMFLNIDTSATSQAFVFKNIYFNEVYIAYPSIGATSCDRAMVWNYVDKTVSFRSLPNVNHAAFGPVDASVSNSWNQDSDPWAADLTLWNGPDYVPATTRVIMASADMKLYMADASASYSGSLPTAYMERRGLTFDAPDAIKMISGIRPIITGNPGETVNVYMGYANDPYSDPTYGAAMPYTIGTTISCDQFVSGRYIAIKFATGSAFNWRLDSFQVDAQVVGSW